MSEILIAVPVLNRPHRAGQVVEAIRAGTTVPHRIMFLCSPGDTEEIAACEASGADEVVVMGWEAGWGDFARKINWAVANSDEPWVFTGADDLCFCPGWAEHAIAVAVNGADYVGTQDLGNDRVTKGDHSTHSLVSRRYIDEFGTIDEKGKLFHEGYGHQFCDDEAVQTAKVRRRFVMSWLSEVPHLHPNWGHADDDATYRKGLACFHQDQRLFHQRERLWLGGAVRRRA